MTSESIERFKQALIDLCTGNTSTFTSEEVATKAELPHTIEVHDEIPRYLHNEEHWFAGTVYPPTGTDTVWIGLRPRHLP